MLHILFNSVLLALTACGSSEASKIEAYGLGRLAGGLESSTLSRPSAHLTSRGPTRRLTSGDNPATVVTVVTSGADFMTAAIAGAEHIELHDHIILENNHAPPWAHLELPPSIKSIRGNCVEPFPTSGDMGTGPLVPALLNQKPGQCILMLGATLSFHGVGGKTDRGDLSGPVTLVENMYLRAIRQLQTMHIDSDRDIYMSNVTIQGGVSIEGSPPDGAGGARLQGALYAEGALIVASLHGRTRLEQCTYTSNSVSQDFFDNNEHNPSVFYSDESLTVGFLLGNDIMTSPLETADGSFMTAGDGRVAAIRAEVENAERVGPHLSPPLNHGLSPSEPLPPTVNQSPSRHIDDAQPAPGATPPPPDGHQNDDDCDCDDEHNGDGHHNDGNHAGDGHTHEPDHTHWWHRNQNGVNSQISIPSYAVLLPFLELLVLGLLN